ncbi:hypothetical protein EYF80_030688 [Liparis tanakae]|uniref:Uncharacterized protein n=1 Tax=Liparis tanakae TaxID=230148 RepID=A0A4Z2H2L0_9TELE|nr:hypothetical protein EYF80_030688 [Liparis tanakae]
MPNLVICEGRVRRGGDPEPRQALRQAVGAPAGQRERSVAAAVLLGRRRRPLLPSPASSVALGFSPVLGVAAPLPPEEAGTLLAAQMVQRRCPGGGDWGIHRCSWLRSDRENSRLSSLHMSADLDLFFLKLPPSRGPSVIRWRYRSSPTTSPSSSSPAESSPPAWATVSASEVSGVGVASASSSCW